MVQNTIHNVVTLADALPYLCDKRMEFGIVVLILLQRKYGSVDFALWCHSQPLPCFIFNVEKGEIRKRNGNIRTQMQKGEYR